MLRERTVTILAALCYVPFASVVFCLILLLRYPHSSFAIYHVKQGLAAFLVWFFSLFLMSFFVLPGLIFWALLLYFGFRVAVGALREERLMFPGLKALTHSIPAEKIYSYLTGTHFPSSFTS